jgi:hypothetical protein
MTRLEIDPQAPALGELVYRAEDHSFDTVNRTEDGEASLLVNDVQLEIDGENRVLFVWGLCPHTSWAALMQGAPPARPARLRVIGLELQPGTSKRLNADARWRVSADRRSGWICLGDFQAAGEAIQFAPGAVAVLADGALKALWLKPTRFPDGANISS